MLPTAALLASPPWLLPTKLHCPPADPTWVSRPDLLARLDAGLAHKLILLSAPPGFGKTTLVSQWLHQRLSGQLAATSDQPSCAAWLSLDKGDNDLAQFLRYLVAAVRTCVPEACPTTLGLLDATLRPGMNYLADLFMAELVALPTDLILVLDDYHLIRSHDIHACLRRLLRHRPSRLRLVILTRTDPPLQLGRWRAEGHITELRAADLRFTPEATRRFLHRRVAQPLDETALQALHTRTEGWITALHLASLALQTQDVDDVLAHFGGDRLLVGYLVEEVMAQLPASVRAFVTRTALGDRFCAPLADALLADSDPLTASQAIIAQLEKRNLFLIPLDDEGVWYRYHDLFRDFLRHRLQREVGGARLADLHRCASVWFAQAGLGDEAIRHALAAGDEGLAAEWVETALHSMLNQQTPWPVLEHWVSLFSEPALQAQPGPLIAQAYLFMVRFNVGPLLLLLDRLEHLLQADSALSPQRRQALQANCDWLRGYSLYWRGEAGGAIVPLERAIASLPDSHVFARAQTTFYLILAYAATGQRAAGLTLLHAALAEATAYQRHTLMILLGALTTLHLYAADLTETARTAERMLAVANEPSNVTAWQGLAFVDIWRAWAYYVHGAVAYERNELAAAADDWQQVVALSYRANPRACHESLVGLALVAQARGAATAAVAQAQAAREFAATTHSMPLLQVSDALEARLALLGGQTETALRRAHNIDLTANHGTAVWLDLPPLARVRALLAEATPTALTTALAITTACLRQAEAVPNTRQMVQISAQQSLVLYALRRTAEAFDALDRALSLGAPGKFVRTFLDLGTPMADLLREFDARRGPYPYVKRLLAAFAHEPGGSQHQALTTQYARLYGITPLTPREIELLTLINRRFSIDEIAGRLAISPNTVKKHANNIYTKLGARNRREAIAKAQDVGLLTPDAS